LIYPPAPPTPGENVVFGGFVPLDVAIFEGMLSIFGFFEVVIVIL
jgi:hypothetical protein